MNEEIKVNSMYLLGKHICDSLLKSDPHLVTIDENDRLILVSQSQIVGSNIVWIQISFCPFCGVKL